MSEDDKLQPVTDDLLMSPEERSQLKPFVVLNAPDPLERRDILCGDLIERAVTVGAVCEVAGRPVSGTRSHVRAHPGAKRRHKQSTPSQS